MNSEPNLRQLSWSIYAHLERACYGETAHLIYTTPEKLAEGIDRSIIVDLRHGNMSMEFTSSWIRVYFYGVELARSGCEAVNGLAQGVKCRVSLQETARWPWPAQEDQPKRQQKGWGLFISADLKTYSGQLSEEWLPPRSDERFEYRLHDFLTGTDYGYKLEWVKGDYQFSCKCKDLVTLESASRIFPEYPQFRSKTKAGLHQLTVTGLANPPKGATP